MTKHDHAIGYALAFLALLGFLLGWKLFIARPSPESAAEYKKRIHITAANISAPAETVDDALRIYAVNVVHIAPFKDPFVGYGIYLGRKAITRVKRVPLHKQLRPGTALHHGVDLPVG